MVMKEERYNFRTNEEYTQHLRKILNEYTMAWAHGEPLISDIEYDKVLEELVELEGEQARPFTRVKKPDGIVDTPNQTLSKVYGVRTPMRPGQKTYQEWIASMRNIDEYQEIYVQAKFDGVSVSWDIRENKWFTRGDYDNGESMEVTDLFKERYIPMKPEHQKPIAMKFEAIMCIDVYEAMFKKYVNPRAAVSAIIMSHDRNLANWIDLIQLRYYYEDGSILIPDYHMESQGVSMICHYNNLNLIEDFIADKLNQGAMVEVSIDDEGNRHMYEIDGVVVSFISEADGGDGTLTLPATETAIKILNNVKETKIKAIEWQMGKTGKITPVGVLEPVTFDNGITVDHVGLSTFERVYDLNLHFDETVRVMHNIVPYLMNGKGDGGMRIPTPTKCPACGHPLNMNNLKTIRCTNPECQSKKLGDIIRYCENMKMMGVSKGILTKLYEMGYVTKISELYTIKGGELAMEKGFAETSVNALLKSIKNASTLVPPERWFGALPCLNVSQKTWKTILQYNLRQHKNFIEALIHYIMNESCEDFLSVLVSDIPGIGPATWAAIIEGFRNNWDDIKTTVEYVSFEHVDGKKQSKGKVCLSGTRDKSVITALELAGYEVTDSWSSDVDYLVIPDVTYESSKVRKAFKQNTIVMTVDTVLNRLVKNGTLSDGWTVKEF